MSKFRSKINRLLFVLTLLSATVANTAAQHQHHPASEPATLLAGLGNLRHPVSTKNAEAQKFFDQGLTLIYAFNHEEARRSFARAAQLDPQLGMAHWGIALAVGPNYNEAQVDPARLLAADLALAKAKELLAHATTKERAYIEALGRRFQLKTDPKQCMVDYKDAMRTLHQQYPDDIDAAVLYADSLMNLTPWQLWAKDGQPGKFTTEIVRVLEAALKRDSQHLGANHLYIHAVEASKTPARALSSANKLGKLAPNAGHLVHMPAHIYIRTGDYEASAQANETAAEVDRAYIKATGARGMYPAMYYSHNLHFLVESYNRAGNYEKARRSAAQLAENVRGHIKEMPMLEGFLPSVLFVQLRFNRWDEVLKQPEPSKEMPVTYALWHYARGVAWAGQGKLTQAQEARQTFAQLVAKLPGDTPFGLNTAANVMQIAECALAAQIARANGDTRANVEHWRKAVAAADALNYDEPPGWYYPVRESLGAALLRAGDASEAEKVFRRDLEDNAGNGRALFGLSESLRKQGKKQAARRAQDQFEKAWRNADTKLKIEDL